MIVHVGFAISQVDEAEAREIFSYLEQIGQAQEELRVGEASAGDGQGHSQ